MDSSILEFFEILELESGIRFSTDSEALLEEKLMKIQRIDEMRRKSLLL